MPPKNELSLYFFVTRKPGQVAAKFLYILIGTSLIGSLVICGGAILAASVTSVNSINGFWPFLRISITTLQNGAWNIVALSLFAGVIRASITTYRDWQAFIPSKHD